ncbi:MAG: hypothetical protein HC809_04660 [Gammaproteobacteria bacterium]|nr:hypothetical protein [Gammaproteobacteria bacterium]
MNLSFENKNEVTRTFFENSFVMMSPPTLMCSLITYQQIDREALLPAPQQSIGKIPTSALVVSADRFPRPGGFEMSGIAITLNHRSIWPRLCGHW